MWIFIFRLCPKSYFAICHDKDDENDKEAKKIASKGVPRITNKYTYNQYKSVLYDGVTLDAVNYTIRKFQGSMRSLKCTKRGLSSVHIKNMVSDDRVTTKTHMF